MKNFVFFFLSVVLMTGCGYRIVPEWRYRYLEDQSDLIYQDKVAGTATPTGLSLEVEGPGCLGLREMVEEKVVLWWVPSGVHHIPIRGDYTVLWAYFLPRGVPEGASFTTVSNTKDTVQSVLAGQLSGRCRTLRAWLRDQGLAEARNGGPGS